MDNIRNIAIYIFQNYPNPLELSISRLVKLVFLADWKSSIINDRQITNIKWSKRSRGPYGIEVAESISTDKLHFNILFNDDYINHDLNISNLDFLISPIKNEEPKSDFDLLDEDKKILDDVLSATAEFNWQELSIFVDSLFPMIKTSLNQSIDLKELSEEYKNLKLDKRPHDLERYLANLIVEMANLNLQTEKFEKQPLPSPNFRKELKIFNTKNQGTKASTNKKNKPVIRKDGKGHPVHSH
jgi:hypothetical protein